jgi:hypothetical protein
MADSSPASSPRKSSFEDLIGYQNSEDKHEGAKVGEIESYIQARTGKRLDKAARQAIEGLFDKIDADGDGHMSKEEFKAFDWTKFDKKKSLLSNCKFIMLCISIVFNVVQMAILSITKLGKWKIPVKIASILFKTYGTFVTIELIIAQYYKDRKIIELVRNTLGMDTNYMKDAVKESVEDAVVAKKNN